MFASFRQTVYISGEAFLMTPFSGYVNCPYERVIESVYSTDSFKTLTQERHSSSFLREHASALLLFATDEVSDSIVATM